VETNPQKAVVATSETVKLDPGAWERMLARISGSASSGQIAPQLRRRTVSVLIYPEMCRPDTFAEPFRIDLQELDSATELRALRAVDTIVTTGAAEDEEADADEGGKATPAGQSLSMALGRASIRGINGRVLAPHEVSLLWEILAMGGRLVVGMAFMAHCTGIDPDLTKKSLASAEVG